MTMVLKHLHNTEKHSTLTHITFVICMFHFKFTGCQNILHVPQTCKSSSVLFMSLTCFTGHANHALLVFPEADVILEGQKVKQQLKKMGLSSWTQKISFAAQHQKSRRTLTWKAATKKVRARKYRFVSTNIPLISSASFSVKPKGAEKILP